MALTRDFKETVKLRAERDIAFREALLTEAVEQLIAGEVEVGKAILRDYINATMGFEKLAKATGTPSKSLMRMFGPKGNPRANNDTKLNIPIGTMNLVSVPQNYTFTMPPGSVYLIQVPLSSWPSQAAAR